MNSGKQAHGYTIVEVMFFLIISGSLLVTGLYFFSGRQSRIQFTQGVIETESRLRTIINETASGYYPNKGDFSCSAGSTLTTPSLTKVSSKAQGTNEGCIFLGKVVHFLSPSTSTYNVYTVVGNQRNLTPSQEVTALQGSLLPQIAGANPIAVYDDATPPDLPDNTEGFTMPWGLKVIKIITPLVSPLDSVNSIGFILTFGSYSVGVDPGLLSGSQNVDVIPVAQAGSDLSTTVNKIRDMKDSDRNPGQIIICIDSNISERHGAIILGGQGRGLSTETKFDNNTPIGCTS